MPTSGEHRCLCCGQADGGDLLGPRCDCTRDGTGWGVRSCYACGHCSRHCRCPDGPTMDWGEVTRRVEVGKVGPVAWVERASEEGGHG